MANIETELKRMREGKQLNAINLYLLGVILKQKGNSEEARDIFIEALNKMPLLWTAWLELAQLIQQKDARSSVFDKLTDHWAKNFYYACFFLDK
jgi:anaphase-promoting complex subunit 8